MLHRKWFVLLSVGLWLIAIGLFNVAGATSAVDVPYDELKRQFATDETLEGIKVTGFNDSEVTVVYKGRYINWKRNQLTPAQRKVIEPIIAAETEQRRTRAAKEHEQAARLGYLREVDGVVYNLMNPSPEWTTFRNVRVVQKVEEGALINASRSDDAPDYVFVLHLPQFEQIADNDKITFLAKQSGTFSYVSSLGIQRTIRQYDCGTAPGKNKKSIVRSPNESKSPIGNGWASSGTGFFITEDGYIATCNHVVEDAKRIEARTAAGTLKAQVVATDPTNDVAILKVAGTFTALAVNTNRVFLGQPAFTIGFPNIDIQGLSPKYTDGKVSSLSGIQDDASAIQISVPVQPGNSGGPLTDANGNVIGLVVARLNDYAALRRTRTVPQNVNYAVKSSALGALARKAGLQDKVRFGAVTHPTEEAVGMVEKATVLLLVAE